MLKSTSESSILDYGLVACFDARHSNHASPDCASPSAAPASISATELRARRGPISATLTGPCALVKLLATLLLLEYIGVASAGLSVSVAIPGHLTTAKSSP